MNKVVKSIINIFCKIFLGIIIFIFFCYFGLWIYTINYVREEFKEYYKNYKILDLTEDQYKIIWFTLTENKNYRFKWHPFIFDIISDFNSITSGKPSLDTNLPLITAEDIIFRFGYNDINNAHPRYYSLERYVRSDNNWKKCISIVLNDYHFWTEYGKINIVEASICYYKKEIQNINEKELIGLILFFNNRHKYEIGTEYTQNKINELYNRYKNE